MNNRREQKSFADLVMRLQLNSPGNCSFASPLNTHRCESSNLQIFKDLLKYNGNNNNIAAKYSEMWIFMYSSAQIMAITMALLLYTQSCESSMRIPQTSGQNQVSVCQVLKYIVSQNFKTPTTMVMFWWRWYLFPIQNRFEGHPVCTNSSTDLKIFIEWVGEPD